jgi:hypothetical protein
MTTSLKGDQEYLRISLQLSNDFSKFTQASSRAIVFKENSITLRTMFQFLKKASNSETNERLLEQLLYNVSPETRDKFPALKDTFSGWWTKALAIGNQFDVSLLKESKQLIFR